MSDRIPKRVKRDIALQREWGQQLVDVAAVIADMGRAMIDGDGIAGTIAGEGIANHFPALPSHIRHLFMEWLDDEAARGHRADMLYLAEWKKA